MSRKLKRVVSILLVAALLTPSGLLAPVVKAETSDTVVYHETFANGIGAAKQSGSASLTPVSDKVFDGNADGMALSVSNRSHDFDAADFNYSDIGLENGKTYTVTISVYVDAGETVPAGAQAYLQTAAISYGFLASADFAAGSASTLTKEFTVDTSKDTKLRVQSNDKGVSVPFYLGDVLITAKQASAATDTVIYHETFANDIGAAKQSGSASLTQVSNKVFDGNADGKALSVSNRSHDFDAADFNYSDIGLENGKTYTVTISVYVDAGETVPAGAQAYLQTADISYGFLAGADFAAGSASTLTKEFTVDTSKDTKLRVQSNDKGASVPFYIGDVLITEKVASGSGGGTDETPRPAALPFSTITFEDQSAGGFVGRSGKETLTVTNEANHTAGGSYALKVEGRTSTWHGPSLRVEKYVDKGYEYKISAWVKLIEPASSQLQLSTQIGNGSSANYVALAKSAISTSDGWVLYEGTYRYNSVGGEYLTIYVESASDATASFYMDDVSFVSTGSGPTAIQKDLTPLKGAYQNDFLIGNVVSAEDMDGVRFDLLKMHHNVATAGNAMKPVALYDTNGNLDFSAADDLVTKVLAAGLKMHGHVLVWHQQSPTWMNTSDGTTPLGRDEALQNMKTHIQKVMEHFGNKVISWDVVNEAMNDNPGNPADWQASLRQSSWYNAIGPDYVEQAFLAAREVLDAHPGWDIKLYYNDYNEDNQNKATAIYNMIKDLNDKYAKSHSGKLLIDGMGMQGHYNINTNPANVELSLEKFISLGVEVSITELDVTVGSNYQLSDQLANAQGYLYAQLLKIFKAHADHIARVTFWGMDDNTSWRSSQNPVLFDKNLQAKPAYYGVIDPDTFISQHTAGSIDARQSTAAFGTPVIDGTVDTVWSGAPELPINRYQMAWQGASGVAKVLWDDQNLYVLVQVSDTQLDKSNENAWEQDSVEVFVDENNGKTTFYQDDDGQYRVNFDNETTFSPASIADGFVSATHVSGTNYTVEMKIPFKKVTPSNDSKLGFDVQINDAKDKVRQSVAAWNDTTGQGYQDTSIFGVLTLNGKTSDISVTGVTLDQSKLSLTVSGATATLTATVQPTNATNKNVTWSSNDTSVAIVDNTGVVTPVRAGTATITVTTADGGHTATSIVTVNAASTATPTSTSTSTQGPINTVNNNQITAKAQPDSNGIVSVTISSNDFHQAISQTTDKTVKIQVQSSTGVKEVQVNLPTDQVQAVSDQIQSIVIDTGLATVTLDPKLLNHNDVRGTGNVQLSVAVVDPASLSEMVRDQLGGNTVYNFSLSVNGEKISKFIGNDVKVSMDYTLKPGENPHNVVVYYIDDSGRLEVVKNGKYNAATGKVEFTPKHFSKYFAKANESTFKDVNIVPWAMDSIQALEVRGIVAGVKTGTFAPNNEVTRVEFTQMLMNALDLNDNLATSTFTDVLAGAWYYQAIASAQQLGIVSGKTDGSYGINDKISRQDMAVMIYRATEKANIKLQNTVNAITFTDDSSIAVYAAQAIKALQQAGIVTSMENGRFSPNGTATRAEAAVVIYELLMN
ncbi:endo-1,4-beta-xylanase [Gorillibacterium massiliense]|uniref:endo-1,4-beta-xylanase n=1 Tax=Gorillibacterium massiliense TaxID=1280390 RepID=UPI0004AFF740|nr:endo-1,4-beta-xylanase [Gorillibacterium massiliense]